MSLSLRPPALRYLAIHYGVESDGEYIEDGPVLVATYDEREFQLLWPEELLFRPLFYEIFQSYSQARSPEEALACFTRDFLRERALGQS